MSMLMFMPWCRIKDAFQVGDITILPFDPQQPLAGVSGQEWTKVYEVLSSYKGIKGSPVDRAALIQVAGKSLRDDVTPDEIDLAGDLVSLACFAALAKREFFGFQFDYCNSDCFALVLQKFDASDYTALTIGRRDGRTLSAWSMHAIAISVPAHCHVVKEVSFDAALLDALDAHRRALSAHEWGRWQNAIACFNQACTDSDNIRDHVEWVLLCSAFEHLLEAKSDAKDVARLFDAAVVPPDVILAEKSVRMASRPPRNGTSIRYEWMREFYRLRGDFAHGKLNPKQPMTWKPHEHLLLATLAFPLVVKSLLVRAGRFTLTADDEDQIGCFEKLADTPDFFNAPPDPKGSGDSHWMRLLSEYRRGKLSEDFRNECYEALAALKQASEQGEEGKS